MPPEWEDFTPPSFVRQGQDKPRRPQASGAGLDSQRPPVRFVTKGGIPSEPACAGFPVVEVGAFPSHEAVAVSGVIDRCAPKTARRNASHRETY